MDCLMQRLFMVRLDYSTPVCLAGLVRTIDAIRSCAKAEASERLVARFFLLGQDLVDLSSDEAARGAEVQAGSQASLIVGIGSE